nr:class I adenylate-forming enzyme family protein [Deltaproteobacteria bacterium]
MSQDRIAGLFCDEVQAKCEQMPDFPVVTFENGEGLADEVVTYKDLFLNGCRVAKALNAAGIGKGDRFSLVMRNHPEFLYTMLAASITGSVVVPIDPRSKGSKLSYQIKDSNSKGIIYTSEFSEDVEKSLAELKDVTVIGVSHKVGFKVPAGNHHPSLN